MLDVLAHPNSKKHPGQGVLVVAFDGDVLLTKVNRALKGPIKTLPRIVVHAPC